MNLKIEVKRRFGFTVNVGISSNKLLAKMASDFEKPDKVHTLFPQGDPGEDVAPAGAGALYGGKIQYGNPEETGDLHHRRPGKDRSGNPGAALKNVMAGDCGNLPMAWEKTGWSPSLRKQKGSAIPSPCPVTRDRRRGKRSLKRAGGQCGQKTEKGLARRLGC